MTNFPYKTIIFFSFTLNSFAFFDQSDEELKRRDDEERAQLELREREMFHQRLRQQRLESEADSKWLQQEEQNIELPFSPVCNKLFLGFRLC